MIAHPTEGIGGNLRANEAGYFLVSFGHTNVLLTQIIGKGNIGIGHEAQGFGFIMDAFHQVLRFAALRSSTPTGRFPVDRERGIHVLRLSTSFGNFEQGRIYLLYLH